MGTPDMKHEAGGLPPRSRSNEDVEWRQRLDVKWFGMGGPAQVRLFGGQYVPEKGGTVGGQVSAAGDGHIQIRVLARPWVRLVFSTDLPTGEGPDTSGEVSPVDVLFPVSPDPLETMVEETGFVVDLLVDDYVFDRKELRLHWRCRVDGQAAGVVPDGREDVSTVLSGRLRVTLDPALSEWELSAVVEALQSTIRSRGVTDERLAAGRVLLVPHPDNPFQNADEALVFVAGCWLSLRLHSLTFAEGVECPVGYGRTVPLWMPLSRDRYYLTDSLLRGGR